MLYVKWNQKIQMRLDKNYNIFWYWGSFFPVIFWWYFCMSEATSQICFQLSFWVCFSKSTVMLCCKRTFLVLFQSFPYFSPKQWSKKIKPARQMILYSQSILKLRIKVSYEKKHVTNTFQITMNYSQHGKAPDIPASLLLVITSIQNGSQRKYWGSKSCNSKMITEVHHNETVTVQTVK